MTISITDISRWEELARDVIFTTLPQTRERYTLEHVMQDYNLTTEEFVEITQDPKFRSMVKAQRNRAREMGYRAGYFFRIEEMLDGLAERLYSRLIDEENPATISDIVKGFTTLAKSAGLESIVEPLNDRGVNMAIQINVPQLSNPKLDYLKGSTE
jgi:hypothetical protein